MTTRRWSHIRLIVLAAYVGAVVASGVWIAMRPASSAPHPPETPPIGATRLTTDLHGVTLSVLRWPAREQAPDALPVILIHGGPGRGRDFAGFHPTESDPGLAGMLAARRDVYAPDLLGFGESTHDVPDYSILADARALLAWMDARGIARAHIVGWSQGGGVALHMADLAPDQIASVTLMAAIGLQETEGSRSYYFEQARYALGDGLRIIGPWLAPHFGALAPVPPAFTRYFSDSDQRPLGAIMRRLRIPTLVLHGRRDFLVPAWAAEEHARAIPHAQLIMTGGSHFVPFWPEADRRKVTEWLETFWSDHDSRAAAPDLAAPGNALSLDLAPHPRLFGRIGLIVADTIIAMPWWMVVVGLAMLARRREGSSRWAIAFAGAMVVSGLIDYAVAWIGLALGARAWLGVGYFRARRMLGLARPSFTNEWRERSGRGVLWAGALATLRPDLRSELPAAAASLLPALARRMPFLLAASITLAARQLMLLMVAVLVIAPIFRDPFHPLREWGVVLGIIAARVAVAIADDLSTIPGRHAIRARAVRLFRFEFWPTWVVYLLLFPTYLRGAIRARHPIAFTACNPGIENGGGVIGESKFAIMQRLRESAAGAGLPADLVRAVCATAMIDPGNPSTRADRWLALTTDPASGITAPTILKPITGYRGRAVRRVSSRDEAERYFRMMPLAALVQPWHPGPGEVGVAWLRGSRKAHAGSDAETGAARVGHIFSITLKEFAFLTGDGRRTIERLIWRHPRYRLQAATFLSRLAGERLRVPAAGEQLSLGVAGNHCQGSLFRDGAHLITPELEAAIDRLAAAYTGPDGQPGGLDAIRLDIRYRSEDDLKAGRLDANAIVEMNGTTGESTNIYDPDKPLSWSLGVLSAQWAALYDLGRERMDAGVRPLSIPTLFVKLFKGSGRAGSALSD